MQLPLQLDGQTKQTLQEQLFQRIRQLILRGSLKPGVALPSTRELSAELKISRNTVLLSYERLIAEGYLEPRPAKGTFVSSAIPEHALALPFGPTAGGHSGQEKKRQNKLVFHGHPHSVFTPRERRVAIDFKVGRPDARSFPH